MKLTKSKLGMTALAVGGVLAFALPAGAAVNLQSESPGSPIVKITKEAKLKANGAATIVTLNVTCPAGWTFSTQANVTQTVGSITTGGRGYTSDATCTGVAQKVKVPVTASPAPFHAGQAYATADLAVRSPNYYYTNVSTGRVIVNVES